eukprot:TRINITY_DN877_c0_g1_i2.p3 TRINITY_DN877_c0_g1~~TRINITY_DN877_c0_g1_i2.p3  ORF type:complete len:151 (+),score=19.70 TRINITY_DN877_c0_g1_i2:172-624(+)
MSQTRRIMKELKDIQRDPPPDITIELLNSDDIYKWGAKMKGPADSPYAGGVFGLEIQFPPDYPFRCPRVRFTTKVYHTNVDDTGFVSIDILKENWSPQLTIAKVLLSIQALLTDPNANNPLVPEIAHVCRTDRKRYDDTARAWTKKYAMP